MSEDRQRLSVLADSVNDTARIARTTLSLLLLLGLYLGLTLLSATDENLFHNSIVALPQINTGISLKQSFLFAPAIFCYLHLQSLFFMRVLKRKLDSFDKALEDVFGNEGDAEKKECLDWLSAFSFVQLFRNDSEVAHISRLFVWIGTSAAPLVLLFLIDISFLRYQSFEITLWHHVLFFADIIVVQWFNRHVLPSRLPKIRVSLRITQIREAIAKTDIRKLFNNAFTLLILVMNKGTAIIMMLVLVIYAWIPGYDLDMEVNDHQVNVLRGKVEKGLVEALWDNENLLDVVLCPRWSWSCRRLNGEGLQLTRHGPSGNISRISENFQEDVNRIYRMSYGIELSGRSLRFANLENAWLPGAKLLDVDLRGALLRTTQLYGANMTRAKVDGAYMYQARLNRADLRKTNLRKAVLSGAELNDVDFCEANLEGASLNGAELDMANFHLATLKGTNLHVRSLKSANFHGANLEGATIIISRLECTNFLATNLNEAKKVKLGKVTCSNFHAADFEVEQDEEGNACKSRCPTRERKIPDCREPGYIRSE